MAATHSQIGRKIIYIYVLNVCLSVNLSVYLSTERLIHRPRDREIQRDKANVNN